MQKSTPRKKKVARRSLDLSPVDTTDIHCFAFPNRPDLTKAKLSEIYTLGGPTVFGVGSMEGRVEQNRFEALPDYTLFLNHLSKFLRCSPSTDSVIKFRNKKIVKSNFQTYVGSLFKDVKLNRLCIDDGLYPVDLEQLKNYVPCKLNLIVRIENIIKKLFERRTTKTYSDLEEEFERALTHAARIEGAIAFKSIIAYRSGLDIDPSEDEKDAEKEFDELLQGKAELSWFGPVVKKIRNSLLIRAIKKARELGIFFEIHTGLGDTDILASKCNPILLQGLFKDRRISETNIVLVHGGYPFTNEACWLARDFPNIFIETSTPFPPAFANTLSRQRFLDILSMVPPNRIVYGSDCFDLPELHWLSAKLSKLSASEAFAEMIARELIDEDQCYSNARLMFSGNANALISKR